MLDSYEVLYLKTPNLYCDNFCNQLLLIVSIIVPNYNHAPFLNQRLDSIFNQTFQDFEVILLDDASTDNSLSILEDYKEKFKSKVSHLIVNEKNSGSPFKQFCF